MDSLSIQLFYVPTIALLMVAGFYFYYSKRIKQKKGFIKFFWSIAMFAYLFNLIWEVSQGFLYEGFVYDFKHISFCALASIADVFMVFLLYFGFSLLYRNVFWIQNLTFGRGLILIVVGGLGAIFAETRHLAAGHWAYEESMPLLPFVEAGLAPVLQFIVLPILIYKLSFESSQKSFEENYNVLN